MVVSMSLVGMSVVLIKIFHSGIGRTRILAPSRRMKKDNLAIRIFGNTLTYKSCVYLLLTERETEITLS